MSVNSKMTAIADKIRALLGISGTMGLDAMATNLGTEQTNVTNAFTAVGNKGGTVPTSKVSGNLAAAINSIQVGSAAQIKTGTTRFYSGYLGVECGFKPDVVIFDKGEYYSSGSYGRVYYTAAIAFNSSNLLYGPTLLTNAYNYKFYTFYTPTQHDTGMYCDLYGTNSSWGESKISSGVTFNYTAIKYT